MLDAAACGPDVAVDEYIPVLRQHSVWVTLIDTDERLPRLLALLRHHGVEWIEIRRDRYTDEELDRSKLIIAQPNRECEVIGGVEYGTTYDLSGACPACGTGARQTSALFIDGEDIEKLEGHRAGASIFWHVLVDERLAAELENIGATGLSFRSVYAVMRDKRQIKLRWKQLCAERTLPPMSPRTTGLVRDRACRVCNRNGYARTPEEFKRIHYRARDVERVDDVNMTWEWFGFAKLQPNLRDSLLSYPWLLVTPKVMRVFRNAGVTEFDWLPIRVDEG